MSILLQNTDRAEFTSLTFNEVVLGAARRSELDINLFVLPTRRRVREVEREIADEHLRLSGRPIERMPIYTIDLFVREFYSRLEPVGREISPEVQLALIYRAMQKSDLEFFGSADRDPSAGVAERIARVIAGVRADGIMPSDFEKDLEFAREHADARGYDVSRLSDLYLIYSEYLRLLNRFWSDHPGRIARLNTILNEQRGDALRRAFPDLRSILFHSFREFTQPEIALLQQLGYVPDLQVRVYLDYEEGNGPLYGNFEDVYHKLTVAGYRAVDLDPLEENIQEKDRRPFNHHMRRNLFRTDERIGNGAFDTKINVYGFLNREEETQGIAALVKSLVMDDGIAPEKICIATFGLDRYARLLSEHLAGHGIPANNTASRTLDRSGLMTALLAALAIPSGSFDHRDVVRAITSPYLDFGDSVDSATIVETANRLRIRRGKSAWQRRIASRLDYVRRSLLRSHDTDELEQLNIELSTLTMAARGIERIGVVMGGVDKRMTPHEFRDAFRHIIAELRVTENILQLRRDLDKQHRPMHDWQRVHDGMEQDTRALAAMLRMLDEMTEFFDVEYGQNAPDIALAPARHGDGRYTLDFYIENLRTASLRASYRLREKHDHGVLVTSTSAMQGLDFDAVILCGLVDGEFPSTYLPETFLGKPVEGAQDRQLRRERMEFYGTITAFTQRLILTWPRFNGDTELVRSSFLDAFLRITTVEKAGRVVKLDELRILREQARHGQAMGNGTDPLVAISTLDALAEEAGAALWRGSGVPPVQDDGDMLENLRHTVAVEKGRDEATANDDTSYVPEYRGIITHALSPAELAFLGERRDREYSPSQLELYGRCPFKFFAQRVLHTSTTSNYDATLTPLERGIVLHSLLFRLYTELRDRDELPITIEQRDQVLARAREIAHEEIAGIFFDHPYWQIDQERLLGSDELTGLLEKWIDSDIARGDRYPIPGFFEVKFGGGRSGGDIDGRLSSGESVKVHELNLQGRVDRVETTQNDENLYFTVADYKSGTPPTRPDVRKGLSLQLVLYMEVTRRLLAEHFDMPVENVIPSGGVYYQLDARKIETKAKLIFVPQELKKVEGLSALEPHWSDPKTVEDLEEIIEEVLDLAQEYVSGISSGRFHLTTHDVKKVCRNCEYQGACRVLR